MYFLNYDEDVTYVFLLALHFCFSFT